MRCDKGTMLLYGVTDRAWLRGQTLYQQVESALKGGVTCIQLREKDLPEEQLLAEARELKALCHRYKVPFVINDNVEVAIKCGADGVHVGQHDMEAAAVRAQIGEDMLLGVSVQTVEQAMRAEKNGADYLGVGAVFPTATKADADTVSHSTLREICRTVSIPVCAIGGISKENLPQLKGAGADGVALVSAVFASEDIEAECRELKILSQEMMK